MGHKGKCRKVIDWLKNDIIKEGGTTTAIKAALSHPLAIYVKPVPALRDSFTYA